jgi:hypothetical protein
MARFFGEVGYADSVETASNSGVWEDIITESQYYGDVIRDAKKNEHGAGLNDDFVVNNSISLVADEFAFKHFFKIKYVRWAGVLWTVTSVEVKSPRLILSLGSVYNGPTP